MKKRILIFSIAYHPFYGGAEIALKEITDRMGNDFEFDLITANLNGKEKEKEKVGNVNIYRCGRNKVFFVFRAFLKGVYLHYRKDYSAIWSIMANYAGFSALFFKLFFKEIPFILTLQEGDPIADIRKKVGIFYPWFYLIFKKADIIQAISNYLSDWAKEEGAKCPIFVIPNGVSIKDFKLSILDLQKAEFKKRLGFQSDDIILITVSRLVKKNAIADIILALKYLSKNIKFIIAGDGILKDELNDLTRKENLENRVKFLGFIEYKKLPELLSSSDIFIRPSLSEGFGNSFIEAMASKIPVIATPVGGIVDFLKDGENGLFCEINNPKSIAQKVDKIILDKESKDYMIENALKLVSEKYDWDFIVSNMKHTIFKNILK